jgi:hypothetical protein
MTTTKDRMQNPDTKQRKKMPLPLFLLIVAVYAAHQDFWTWHKADPLVFGFLPIGLAYHAGYAIACAVLMAILVKTAWPKHLETNETDSPK